LGDHRTNGEKLYDEFDGLIDSAEAYGFHVIAEKLRKIRDHTPKYPTAVDEGISMLRKGKKPPAWIEKLDDDALKETLQDCKEALKSQKCGWDTHTVEELQQLEAETTRRKGLRFLDPAAYDQEQLKKYFVQPTAAENPKCPNCKNIMVIDTTGKSHCEYCEKEAKQDGRT